MGDASAHGIIPLREELRSGWRKRNKEWKNNTYDERLALKEANPRMYTFYDSILRKCYDRKHFQWMQWGKLGIQVDESWRYDQLVGWNNFCIDVGILDYDNFRLASLGNNVMNQFNKSTVVWERRFDAKNAVSPEEQKLIDSDNQHDSNNVAKRIVQW